MIVASRIAALAARMRAATLRAMATQAPVEGHAASTVPVRHDEPETDPAAAMPLPAYMPPWEYAMAVHVATYAVPPHRAA